MRAAGAQDDKDIPRRHGVRISLSYFTTEEDMDAVIQALKEIGKRRTRNSKG